jgi:hypothetical protein
MVSGSPSAAIVASRTEPEVTLEYTPSAEAGYLCAASVQKTKPMADMAAVFASRVNEPRYRASLKIRLSDLRVGDLKLMATSTRFTAL